MTLGGGALVLRYGLLRDVEELLAERGIVIDHVTIFRWVQRFTPAADQCDTPCRHAAGARWFVDETIVKVTRRSVYLYRAIDQYSQVSTCCLPAARSDGHPPVLLRALKHGPLPDRGDTDRAPVYPRVLEELAGPAACHATEQYANNLVEADHGRLKARLRPMRGLKQLRSARVISTGHAFVQTLRRGHHELGLDIDRRRRLPTAFTELAHAI